MPTTHHAISGLAFAVWVAVCAAAPELIWQGSLLVVHHFTLLNLYAIVLIGLILAFFVEPILERVRNRRWELEHENSQSLIFSAAFAFALGAAAVALHEGLNAYLGAGESVPDARRESLVQAFDVILQWAFIPFAVTLAWFAARPGWTAAWIAGAIALTWSIAVGWLYAWSTRDIMMVAIPVLMVMVLGFNYVVGEWTHHTFRQLAIGTALLFAGFMLCALAVQGLLWLSECGAGTFTRWPSSSRTSVSTPAGPLASQSRPIRSPDLPLRDRRARHCPGTLLL